MLLTSSMRLLPLFALFLLCAGTVAADIPELTGKYAFVTILYGDVYSVVASNLLATRVLVQSIRLTGTKYPTVILVPVGFPASMKALLEYEGSIVREIDGLRVPDADSTPEEAAVVHSRNKVLLWTLTEYDRIVFLEFDDLVLHSLDQLFLCDNFCAIDKSPLLYTSSLWVVTPADKKTLELVETAVSPQYLSSQRLGITKGFLPLIFEAMEKAPLFEPTAAIPPKGDLAFNGAVLKRLPFFYNVNHLFYYEKMNWNLWRCGFSGNYSIPAMTMSYRVVPIILSVDMFPWLWWSPRLFDNHASWATVREMIPSAYETTIAALSRTGQQGTLTPAQAEALKEEANNVLSRADNTNPHAYITVLVALSYFLIERYLMSQYYFAESRSRIVDKIFTVNRNLSRTMASSEVAVWVSAILVWIMGIVLAWKAVPQCTLPDKGWVLFLVNHVTCLWLSVRFLAVIRGDNMLPSPKLMGPVLTMITILLMFIGFGRSMNGVMKAAVIMGGLVFTILLELKLLRFVTRRVVLSPSASPTKY